MTEFLTNNFIYIIIVVAFIILVLIGYMVDKSKTNKMQKETEQKKGSEQLNIPISNAQSVNTTRINSQINENNQVEKQ